MNELPELYILKILQMSSKKFSTAKMTWKNLIACHGAINIAVSPTPFQGFFPLIWILDGGYHGS
jgi:hypothetical protein